MAVDSPHPDDRVFAVDPNHFGIRLTVLLVALALTFFITAFIIYPLFNVLGLGAIIGIVKVIIGLTLALLLSTQVEKLLVGRWKSGSTLAITKEGISLRKKREPVVSIRWDAPIEVTSWYFEVAKGRSYAPKGYYAVALRLRQGESTIIPYAFFPSAIRESLPDFYAFTRLIPERSARSPEEKEIYMSQADLRGAEAHRWYDGIELLRTDFLDLVAEVKGHVPSWP